MGVIGKRNREVKWIKYGNPASSLVDVQRVAYTPVVIIQIH